MTILWCGGEDLDFNGYVEYPWNTCDSSFARGGIASSTWSLSNRFETNSNVWLSFLFVHPGILGSVAEAMVGIGCIDKSTYIIVYSDKNNDYVHIMKNILGVSTTIASVSAAISEGSYRFDLNIQDYGTNPICKLYLNGILIINYSGTLSLDNGDIDCTLLAHRIGTNAGVSEIIVADEDTRLMRLKTLAPSAAGDTSTNWTGAYTDIDETTLSNADKIYSATADADFQANLTGMPTGTYSVKAVKVAARAVDGSGSLGMALGVKTGGTVNVGATETCSGYWQTKERLMTVNPVTGVAWTPADIEALQLNIRAKAV
jgi:hypothetical protein